MSVGIKDSSGAAEIPVGKGQKEKCRWKNQNVENTHSIIIALREGSQERAKE